MKVFLADIHPEHLRTAGEQVEAVIAENAVHGGEVETMVVDVSKLEDVVRMKEKVIELWGEVSSSASHCTLFVRAHGKLAQTRSPF
jgi:NAD(P)-dependent dehydrogenase (short-subunit alcohol dehydrogenase family)